MGSQEDESKAQKSSKKGLLVSRFVPGGAEKPKAPDAPSASSHAVGKSAKKQKVQEEEIGGPTKDGIANVNPFFARLFRGGPQREASFLPAGEDEGKEATVEEVKQITVEKGGDDWLSSIVEDPEADAGGEEVEGAKGDEEDDDNEDEENIDPGARDEAAGDGTLTWLKSIGAVSASSKAAAAELVAAETGRGRKRQHELSAAAKLIVGKALEVPPFWRTSSTKKLEKELLQNREAFLEHSRRLVKDAKRMERKQGRLAYRKRRVV